MPLPSRSFSRAKWLSFFSELHAKVSHNNPLVKIHACEELKRLLLTQVSVAVFLQEEDTLQLLLEALVNGVLALSEQQKKNGESNPGSREKTTPAMDVSPAANATESTRWERAPSSVSSAPSPLPLLLTSPSFLSLSQELVFTQLDTVSLIIQLMCGLYEEEKSCHRRSHERSHLSRRVPSSPLCEVETRETYAPTTPSLTTQRVGGTWASQTPPWSSTWEHTGCAADRPQQTMPCSGSMQEATTLPFLHDEEVEGEEVEARERDGWYHQLLVLARAGAMLDSLLRIFSSFPSPILGWVSQLLLRLLSLPLGVLPFLQCQQARSLLSAVRAQPMEVPARHTHPTRVLGTKGEEEDPQVVRGGAEEEHMFHATRSLSHYRDDPPAFRESPFAEDVIPTAAVPSTPHLPHDTTTTTARDTALPWNTVLYVDWSTFFYPTTTPSMKRSCFSYGIRGGVDDPLPMALRQHITSLVEQVVEERVVLHEAILLLQAMDAQAPAKAMQGVVKRVMEDVQHAAKRAEQRGEYVGWKSSRMACLEKTEDQVAPHITKEVIRKKEERTETTSNRVGVSSDAPAMQLQGNVVQDEEGPCHTASALTTIPRASSRGHQNTEGNPPSHGGQEAESVMENVTEEECQRAFLLLGQSTSPEVFFHRLDTLWCLTVRGPRTLMNAFTPVMVMEKGFGRFLHRPPQTRQDRQVFCMALRWLGEVLSQYPVRASTRNALAEWAGTALLCCIREDRQRWSASGEHGSTPKGPPSSTLPLSPRASLYENGMGRVGRETTLHRSRYTALAQAAAEAEARYVDRCLYASSFSPLLLPHGEGSEEHHGALLPPLLWPSSVARQCEARLCGEVPAYTAPLLSFLLVLFPFCSSCMMLDWAQEGGLVELGIGLLERVCREQHTAGERTANASMGCLSSPYSKAAAPHLQGFLQLLSDTIDHATTSSRLSMSEEVYWSRALQAVQQDHTTVAVLTCQLMIRIFSFWSSSSSSFSFSSSSSSSSSPPPPPLEDLRALASTTLPRLIPLLVELGIRYATPALSSLERDSRPTSMGVAGVSSSSSACPSLLWWEESGIHRGMSLGEAALLALDACLGFADHVGGMPFAGGTTPLLQSSTSPLPSGTGTGGVVSGEGAPVVGSLFTGSAAEQETDWRTILRLALPSLARCTRRSIYPSLRSVYYRFLFYLLRGCPPHRFQEQVGSEIPFATQAAVECIYAGYQQRHRLARSLTISMGETEDEARRGGVSSMLYHQNGGGEKHEVGYASQQTRQEERKDGRSTGVTRREEEEGNSTTLSPSAAELQAAAGWLQQLLLVARVDAALDRVLQFSATPLPAMLLQLLATLPMSSTSTALWSLYLALLAQCQRTCKREKAESQEREADVPNDTKEEATEEDPLLPTSTERGSRPGCVGDRSTGVLPPLLALLLPHGSPSHGVWKTILRHAIHVNERLASVCTGSSSALVTGVAGSFSCTMAWSSRLVDSIASQWTCNAALLRALCYHLPPSLWYAPMNPKRNRFSCILEGTNPTPGASPPPGKESPSAPWYATEKRSSPLLDPSCAMPSPVAMDAGLTPSLLHRLFLSVLCLPSPTMVMRYVMQHSCRGKEKETKGCSSPIAKGDLHQRATQNTSPPLPTKMFTEGSVRREETSKITNPSCHPKEEYKKEENIHGDPSLLHSEKDGVLSFTRPAGAPPPAILKQAYHDAIQWGCRFAASYLGYFSLPTSSGASSSMEMMRSGTGLPTRGESMSWGPWEWEVDRDVPVGRKEKKDEATRHTNDDEEEDEKGRKTHQKEEEAEEDPASSSFLGEAGHLNQRYMEAIIRLLIDASIPFRTRGLVFVFLSSLLRCPPFLDSLRVPESSPSSFVASEGEEVATVASYSRKNASLSRGVSSTGVSTSSSFLSLPTVIRNLFHATMTFEEEVVHSCLHANKGEDHSRNGGKGRHKEDAKEQEAATAMAARVGVGVLSSCHAAQCRLLHLSPIASEAAWQKRASSVHPPPHWMEDEESPGTYPNSSAPYSWVESHLQQLEQDVHQLLLVEDVRRSLAHRGIRCPSSTTTTASGERNDPLYAGTASTLAPFHGGVPSAAPTRRDLTTPSQAWETEVPVAVSSSLENSTGLGCTPMELSVIPLAPYSLSSFQLQLSLLGSLATHAPFSMACYSSSSSATATTNSCSTCLFSTSFSLRFACCLAEGLRMEDSRMMTLQTIWSLTHSAYGRGILLQDITAIPSGQRSERGRRNGKGRWERKTREEKREEKGGGRLVSEYEACMPLTNALGRCVFGRVLALTLRLPIVWGGGGGGVEGGGGGGGAYDVFSHDIGNPSSSTSSRAVSSRVVQQAAQRASVWMGFDICVLFTSLSSRYRMQPRRRSTSTRSVEEVGAQGTRETSGTTRGVIPRESTPTHSKTKASTPNTFDHKRTHTKHEDEEEVEEKEDLFSCFLSLLRKHKIIDLLCARFEACDGAPAFLFSSGDTSRSPFVFFDEDDHTRSDSLWKDEGEKVKEGLPFPPETTEVYHLLRWLAALSTISEAQRLMLQHADLLSTLIEWAGGYHYNGVRLRDLTRLHQEGAAAKPNREEEEMGKRRRTSEGKTSPSPRTFPPFSLPPEVQLSREEMKRGGGLSCWDVTHSMMSPQRSGGLHHMARTGVASPFSSLRGTGVGREEEEEPDATLRSTFLTPAHQHQVWRSTMALWILRNLCFHPRYKTILCQDGRLVFTLKAALLRLPTALSLVVDPIEMSSMSSLPFTTAVRQRLSAMPGSHRMRTTSQDALRATVGSCAASKREKARRDRSKGWSCTSWCTPFSPSSARSPTPTTSSSSSASSVFLDWAQRWRRKAEEWVYCQRKQQEQQQAVDGRAALPPSSSFTPVPNTTTASAAMESTTFSSSVALSVLFHAEWSSVGRGGGWWGPPAAELTRRQQLAASAWWVLLHGHQKGKLYVRRVLWQEAPAVVFRIGPSSRTCTPPPGLVVEARGVARLEHGEEDGRSKEGDESGVQSTPGVSPGSAFARERVDEEPKDKEEIVGSSKAVSPLEWCVREIDFFLSNR